MKLNDVPISVSLADGYEDPDARGREHGTSLHLDRPEAYLEHSAR